MCVTHNAVVPACEEESAVQETCFARFFHLSLQGGEQVIEPGKRTCIPAEPVEVDLGSNSTNRKRDVTDNGRAVHCSVAEESPHYNKDRFSRKAVASHSRTVLGMVGSCTLRTHEVPGNEGQTGSCRASLSPISLVTFLVLRHWSACWNLYQIDFSTEAKGVTPIPAPTSMATSYWNTSSLAVPKGPSTSILVK